MAAYRRVDDITVTCRLTACTPGSAPGPTLGIEYGKPLPFYSPLVVVVVVIGPHRPYYVRTDAVYCYRQIAWSVGRSLGLSH